MFGIAGALRCDELRQLNVNDVKLGKDENGDYLEGVIRDSKNHTSRAFLIAEYYADVRILDMCKKYIELRPTKTEHSRFFVFYKDNKCTVQVRYFIILEVALFSVFSGIM